MGAPRVIVMLAVKFPSVFTTSPMAFGYVPLFKSQLAVVVQFPAPDFGVQL